MSTRGFEHAYSQELTAFLQSVSDKANWLDSDAGMLFDVYAEFCAAGFHRAGTPDMPLASGSAEWFQFLSQISATSGSLAWVVLQQLAANPYVSAVPFNPWPRLGTAIGHLRTGKVGVAPTWNDGKVNGFSPWYSGAHIAEQAVIGFFLPDGREAYALVDADDRPAFRFSQPVPLQACSSTTNVSITFVDLDLPEDAFLQVEPAGCRAWQDRQGTLNQLPMSLGNAFGSLQVVLESPRLSTAQKERCEAGFWQCFDDVIVEVEAAINVESRTALRSRATELAIQLARIATMCSMPTGLKQGSTASRLYREALFFSCVGPQEGVLDGAIQRAFPEGRPAIEAPPFRLSIAG